MKSNAALPIKRRCHRFLLCRGARREKNHRPSPTATQTAAKIRKRSFARTVSP
jgi:hypothetical protein